MPQSAVKLSSLFLGVILLVMAFDVGSAKSQDAPLNASVTQKRTVGQTSSGRGGRIFYNNYLVLSSVVDSVTITKMTLNRGNCDHWQTFPKTLKFGEVMESSLASCPQLLEVNVETNKGAWTFTFKPR